MKKEKSRIKKDIQKFCSLNDGLNEKTNYELGERVIFALQIPDKGFTWRVCKEHSKSAGNKQTTQLKMGRRHVWTLYQGGYMDSG